MSGNGGIWEDHKASTSADANSPSCSNASVKKKMVSFCFMCRFVNVVKILVELKILILSSPFEFCDSAET